MSMNFWKHWVVSYYYSSEYVFIHNTRGLTQTLDEYYNSPCTQNKTEEGELVTGIKLCVRCCLRKQYFPVPWFLFGCSNYTSLFLFPQSPSWIVFQNQKYFAWSIKKWVVSYSPTATKSTFDLHTAFQYSIASFFTHNLISLNRSELLIMKSWTNNKGHHWCLLSPH